MLTIENVVRTLTVVWQLYCNSIRFCVIQERTLPYIIGLTGSTASGKSSVCARLERLGAVIIDCDKLGKFMFCHVCNDFITSVIVNHIIVFLIY